MNNVRTISADGLRPMSTCSTTAIYKGLLKDSFSGISLTISGVLFIAVVAVLASPIHAENRASCPKTVPSGEVLGKPFPPSDRWYGSEALAVNLPPDGIWRGMGPQHHYRDKLFWWSFGFKPGLESNLEVSAKRLDGNPAKAMIGPPTNAHSPSLGAHP